MSEIPVIVQIRDLLKTWIGGENQEAVPWRSQAHTPNSDRSLNTTRDKLPLEGTLLSVNVRIVSGVPTVGRVHVRVVQEDENQREVHTLCMGYVYPGHEIFGSGALVIRQGDFLRLDSRSSQASIILVLEARFFRNRKQAGGWTGVMKGSLEGPGSVRVITGTNPAIGIEISDTIPTNARWRVRLVWIELVTSTQVGNRTVQIAYDDGATRFFLMPDNGNQVASLTVDYNYGAGLGEARTGTGNTGQRSFPLPDTLLFAGFRVLTVGTTLLTLDNFAAPLLEIEEWIEE